MFFRGSSTLKQAILYLFNNLKLFCKKLLTAIIIIFYILKYYFYKFFFKIWLYFLSEFIKLELFSWFTLVVFSFFFYYFIVIELSIFLFGYSLLCYWFLFIMFMCLFILAWWLEINYLKYQITHSSDFDLKTWIKYYKGSSPLSLYDFLTSYKHWPVFHWLVIKKYENDIEEGRLILFTFFFFLLFFYFYGCAYWFDPHFLNFITKYFNPASNFIETWWNPWLEDFVSAIVWFWNRIFSYLEAKKKITPRIEILKKLTRPSDWLTDRANRQWAHKISLWKTARFSDIFFLWSMIKNNHLWKIVFEEELPISTATRLDPNWELLFLWYVSRNFNNPKNSFWKKHFSNDLVFWNMILEFKNRVNDNVDDVDNYITTHYKNNSSYQSTSYELLLSQNYFNNVLVSKPFFEWFGAAWDFRQNLTGYKYIKWINLDDTFKNIFTEPPYQFTNSSLLGLIQHNFTTWNTNLSNNLKKKFKTSANNKVIFTKLLLNSIMNEGLKSSFEDLSDNFDVPLYRFITLENVAIKNIDFLKELAKAPILNTHLLWLIAYYNIWIGALESSFGLSSSYANYWNKDYMTLEFIVNFVNRWLTWIENMIGRKNIFTYMYSLVPSKDHFQYIFYWYIKPDRLIPIIEWKPMGGSLLKKAIEAREAKEKPKKPPEKKPFVLAFSNSTLDSFINAEQRFQELERLANIRTPQNLYSIFERKKKTNFFISSDYPWYIWSIKYFGIQDPWVVLPGFVRYYTPTPYPSTFSTFGFIWNWYQFFWKNNNSTIVGYSDSIAELWNSTPVALYSGVEAILYFKPLFDIFEYIIKLFIWSITYPIELILTQNFIPILKSLPSLVFFVHVIWFIHFYIYFFLIAYLLYYFFLYYYHKIGFLWFYEWMFEEIILSSYNAWAYWHTSNSLWVNYRSPEQLLLFITHTLLLIHYTFFNYNNFFFFEKKKLKSFYLILQSITSYWKLFRDFSEFNKLFLNLKSTEANKFFIFWSFFNAWNWKLSSLLYMGGTDPSPTNLVWSYFDYLNQTSLLYSWALWWNYYNINNLTEIMSLIKQLTIIFSTYSISPKFCFLSQPLLDTVISWKLLINFFNYLVLSKKYNLNFFLKTFIFDINKTSNIFNYVLNLQDKFEFMTNFLQSGLNVYNLFNFNSLLFPTKSIFNSFWDDPKYWIFVFFWSFRFIPKMQYPYTNIHLSYEDTRLHLARIAYSNSWIGQSQIVWPFFNVIQHLWYTSRVYSRASSIFSVSPSINQIGVSKLDFVWNFFEKWYSSVFSSRVETVFGLVTTLNLNSNTILNKNKLKPALNWNFDLTYSDETIKQKTTNWMYSKTNPPLNVSELGITPNYLFSLLSNLNISNLSIYCTFINQLWFIINDYSYEIWNLENDYDINSENLSNKFGDKLEVSKNYDFYLKKYDLLLWYSHSNEFKNWIFGFDISFFFLHFLSYDNFSNDFTNDWPDKFLSQISYETAENLSLLKTNFDMNSKLTSLDSWFDKPFGVLDKYEMYSMKKYKMTKQLDYSSFSLNRNDPFLNLDKETTVSTVGLSNYPKQDKKNLSEAYLEEFSGFWQKWFPFNSTIIKNSIEPIIIGWVGQLYYSTITLTNLNFSLMYASPELDIKAWDFWNEPLLNTDLLLIDNSFFSYFGKSNYQKQLFSRFFSWSNIFLHTLFYWYSFGTKALARMDYWSWKCGFMLDYSNGLYTYWPYMGLRHSFFSKFVSYDPLYGSYIKYRQIDDNPLEIDYSTDALEFFTQGELDAEESEILKKRIDNLSESEWKNFLSDENYMVPYREFYYSFQHPYFIGYLFYWLFILSLKFLYLGISNFSYKRLLYWNFTINNDIIDLTFSNIFFLRSKTENKYRKQMFFYWKYFINPISLIISADISIDDKLLEPIDEFHSLQNFLILNSEFADYLFDNFKLSVSEITFFFDFNWETKNLFLTNWLTMDLPFSLNPFIVKHYNWLNVNSNLFFFLNLNTFSYSKYTSLHENLNNNLFYDWSAGTYLDTINLISYSSFFWGSGFINNIFFDNPTYLAVSTMWYSTDKSLNLAKIFSREWNPFLYYDLPLGSDLAFHNLALLNFLTNSLEFLILFTGSFLKKNNFLNFLNFYIGTTTYKIDRIFFNQINLPVDSWYTINYNTKFAWFKQIFFLYKIQKNLSYDSLCLLISNGFFFKNLIGLNFFFKSFWFRLTSWFSSILKLYNLTSFFIKLIFYKKWR